MREALVGGLGLGLRSHRIVMSCRGALIELEAARTAIQSAAGACWSSLLLLLSLADEITDHIRMRTAEQRLSETLFPLVSGASPRRPIKPKEPSREEA